MVLLRFVICFVLFAICLAISVGCCYLLPDVPYDSYVLTHNPFGPIEKKYVPKNRYVFEDDEDYSMKTPEPEKEEGMPMMSHTEKRPTPHSTKGKRLEKPEKQEKAHSEKTV